MLELQRRLEKIESKVGRNAIEGARNLVNFYQGIGLIEPDEDMEKLVAEYARTGTTLSSIIDNLAGTSLGPPSLRRVPAQSGKP